MLDEPLPLVVAGAEGWGDLDMPAGGDTRFIGFVPAADLGGLYAGAEVFCYPSEREGYGLPVLEAMVQGTPVVTSRGTATEETADGAAVLVDPHDAGDIARGIVEAGARREALATDGVARADRATWRKTARLDRRRLPGVVLMVDPAIAVNLLWCVPGDVGGSEEYLVRQLLGLAEEASRFRTTLYVVEGFSEAHRDLTESVPTVVASFDGTSRARRIAGETTWFRKRDGGRRPSSSRRRHRAAMAARPYVLTIHDLQYRTYPEYFSRNKRIYLASMIGRSVRRARVVTVPSDYVRTSGDRGLRRRLRRRSCRAPRLRTGSADATSPSEAELRQRFSLGDGPVIVYPASPTLTRTTGFSSELMDKKWRDPDLRFVLTGGAAPRRTRCGTRLTRAYAVGARLVGRSQRPPAPWQRQWCSRASTRASARR